MAYFLFAFYFVIFCWLLLRFRFVKEAGIQDRFVIGLFICKIVAGVVIGWVSLHLYDPHNDYWDINREGYKEYQLLLSNPKEYFSNIFHSGYQDAYGGLFESSNSYWNDLKNNILGKLVSIFDIFTGGNYYVNSLFFNFLIFFGNVALFRVFAHIFPNRKILVLTGCFLLPSTLYFTSGIHKDGLAFLIIGLIAFHTFFMLKERRRVWIRCLEVLLLLVFLFVIRNNVCLTLMPALLGWSIAEITKVRSWIVFPAVYIISAVLFFTLNSFFRKIDPPAILAKRQMEFRQMGKAKTDIQLDSLEPGFKSYLSNLPQASDHVFLRPYIYELPSTLLLPMNIELLIYQLLFAFFIFFHRKSGSPADPFIWAGILFSLSMFIIIGYLVPNLGTLIRYRSIFWPFLITPLLCGVKRFNL